MWHCLLDVARAGNDHRERWPAWGWVSRSKLNRARNSHGRIAALASRCAENGRRMVCHWIVRAFMVLIVMQSTLAATVGETRCGMESKYLLHVRTNRGTALLWHEQEHERT